MDEELKVIVENMIRGGESEENIALVIRNYKPIKARATATVGQPVQEPSLSDYVSAGIGGLNRGLTQVISAPLQMEGALEQSLGIKNPIQAVAEMTGLIEEQEPWATQAGNAIQGFTEEINPVVPGVNQTYQDVAQGIGQGLGMLATAGASAAPTLTQTATQVPSLVQAGGRALGQAARQAGTPIGVIGGSMTAVPEWQAAKEAGLSDEEAFTTLIGNYFVGQTEVGPIKNLLARLNQLTGNKILQIVRASGIGSIEEATQEAIQTYLSNEIAKEEYDPDRDPLFQVLESAKVGGIVGLILPGIGAAIQPATGRTKERLQQKLMEIGNESVKDDVADAGPAINAQIDQATNDAIDAVQVQETGQVPVQPEATTSQEVEEGIPQPEPKVTSEVERSIEETKNQALSPVEAAEKFQGFITGVGEEAINQITEYSEGKFTKRSQFEEFVESYNDRNERKISDTEANKVWERIREPKSRKEDTSRKIKITEMQGLKKQIQDFARGIREGRKDAKIDLQKLNEQVTDKIGKADISATQAKAIINRIGKVNLLNPLRVSQLLRYVDKLSQDAEYAEKFDKAEALQGRLKKAAKSKETFASFEPSLQKMGAINLNNLDKIQSLDDYITQAEQYLASKADVKGKKYNPADLQSLSKYADEAFVESKLVGDELAREMLLSDLGSGLTKEELDYIFSENDDYYENATNAQRTAVEDKLRTVAGYSKMALDEMESDDPIINQIKKIDLNDLGAQQLKPYVRIVDNIVLNNDVSGAGGLESLSKAIEGSKELKGTVSRNLGVIAQSAYNLPNIMKAMFGLSKDASKVRQAIGINDFFGGASRAKTEKDILGDKFNDLKNRLDKKYNKDVLNRENVARMGLAAYLHGYDQGTDPQAVFDKSKRNLEESIEREKTADVTQGQFIEQVYEPFRKAKTIEEVKQIINNQYPDVNEVMNFFRDAFDGIKLTQDRSNRAYDNRYAPIVEDYFPRRYVRSQANKIDISEIADRFDAIRTFNPSTAFSRTNALPANSVVDLSFVDVMFKKYQDTLMDIYANPAIGQMKAFFDLPQAETVFGNRENLERFKEVIKHGVNKELGSSGFQESKLTRVINDISQNLKKVAYLKALGSPTQYLKQATVLANTIVRLGNPKYLLGTPTNAPIYNMYSIGQRGSRFGGIDAGDFVDQKSKYDLNNKITDKLSKIYLGLEKHVWNRIGAPLRNTDVFSAKKSWGAFFKKYLLDNYGIEADLMTAHEQLNDPRYQQAASYAEQMVGETQIASSAGESARFLTPESTAGKITLSLFLPFSTFAFNTKARLLNSGKYLFTGNREQRAEAASSMVGLLSEVAAYNFIGYTLMTTLYPLLDSVWRRLFGFEEPEEDEESNFKQQAIASNVFRDLVPFAVQQNLTDEMIRGLNEVAANQLREDGYTEDEIRNRVPFYVRNESQGVMEGSLYSIPLEMFMKDDGEIDYENNILTVTDKFGNKKEIPIDGNLEDFLIFSSVLETLSMAGITIADINNSVERVKKEQIRQAK